MHEVKLKEKTLEAQMKLNKITVASQAEYEAEFKQEAEVRNAEIAKATREIAELKTKNIGYKDEHTKQMQVLKTSIATIKTTINKLIEDYKTTLMDATTTVAESKKLLQKIKNDIDTYEKKLETLLATANRVMLTNIGESTNETLKANLGSIYRANEQHTTNLEASLKSIPLAISKGGGHKTKSKKHIKKLSRKTKKKKPINRKKPKRKKFTNRKKSTKKTNTRKPTKKRSVKH